MDGEDEEDRRVFCAGAAEVVPPLRMLGIVSLRRWQPAVGSSLHIKQMYGETRGWRAASHLSQRAVCLSVWGCGGGEGGGGSGVGGVHPALEMAAPNSAIFTQQTSA